MENGKEFAAGGVRIKNILGDDGNKVYYDVMSVLGSNNSKGEFFCGAVRFGNEDFSGKALRFSVAFRAKSAVEEAFQKTATDLSFTVEKESEVEGARRLVRDTRKRMTEILDAADKALDEFPALLLEKKNKAESMHKEAIKSMGKFISSADKILPEELAPYEDGKRPEGTPMPTSLDHVSDMADGSPVK